MIKRETKLKVVGTDGASSRVTDAKIRVSNVGKVFDGETRTVALQNVSLNVQRGRFLCIIGPSGCGKTTLLRMLGGLDRPTDGDIELVRDSRDHPLVSTVFQEQSVFPWMTVWRNVEYGLRMRRVPPGLRREIVDRYVTLVGLAEFRNHYPHQLSGGMKQRVSVARAFANDPEVLLMDEPFAALDEQNKVLLQEELLRVWEQDKKTVVFITHSIDEALALGDEIVVMTARPGRIKAVIPVRFARPRSVFDLKADPDFGRSATEIWCMLREEVLLARDRGDTKG